MFLILGALLIVTASTFRGATYDIQLYDTYYLIGWAAIFSYLGLFCCLVEGIYIWLKSKGKFPGKRFKLAHAILTTFSIGLFYFSQVDTLALMGIARRYTTTSEVTVINRTMYLGAGALILFLVVQLIFTIRVLVSLLRNQRAT